MAMGPQESTNIVRFYKHWVENNFESDRLGYSVGEYRDFVEIRAIGDQEKTVVVREVNERHKKEYRVRWEAYQAGLAQIPEGTPLDRWARLTPGDVSRLNAHNIFTIEALAHDLGDQGLQNIGHGARELQNQARMYLEYELPRSSGAALRGEYAVVHDQIEALHVKPTWDDSDAGIASGLIQRIEQSCEQVGREQTEHEATHVRTRDELVEMKEKFGTPRRTEIVAGYVEHEEEDLIQREEMVITFSNTGYLKRVPLSTYRAQRRGGKGRAGMSTRQNDFVSNVFVVNTHTPVLFFSTTGKVYKMKTYRLPLGTPTARGKAMVNLLPLAEGESIETLLPLPEDESKWADLTLMFATAQGNVRRNALSDFSHVLTNGKIAMKLDPGDRIVGVQVCTKDDDVLLAARGGKCVRFPVEAVRVFKSRASTGVRGMKLAKGDTVISVSILRHVAVGVEDRDAYIRYANAKRRAENESGKMPEPPFGPDKMAELAAEEEFILSVTENGYGKRTSAYEYRITSRGGQGIINIETSSRNGNVIASGPVSDQDQMMLVTDGGKLIRSPVHGIRVASRNTQGVTLFNTAEGEKVVSVAWVPDPGANGATDDGGEDDGGAAAAEAPAA